MIDSAGELLNLRARTRKEIDHIHQDIRSGGFSRESLGGDDGLEERINDGAVLRT